jgi:hypothetical protein
MYPRSSSKYKSLSLQALFFSSFLSIIVSSSGPFPEDHLPTTRTHHYLHHNFAINLLTILAPTFVILPYSYNTKPSEIISKITTLDSAQETATLNEAFRNTGHGVTIKEMDSESVDEPAALGVLLITLLVAVLLLI